MCSTTNFTPFRLIEAAEKALEGLTANHQCRVTLFNVFDLNL